MTRPSRRKTHQAFQNAFAAPAGRSAGEDVPYALRVSAAWSWRVGLVIVVSGVLIWLLSHISLLVIPLMVAGLLSSLLTPLVTFLRRHRFPNGVAVAATVISFLLVVGGTLSLVGQQLAVGFADLWDEALAGIQQIQDWLSDGPLHLTSAQIDNFIDEAATAVENNSGMIVSGALSFGSSAGYFLAGLLLTVFALIFFLLDGERIWRFTAGLAPRRARAAVAGAGQRGWTSMANYVRVQILVAFIDAVGIGLGAAIIGVPLVLPLTVLVFLGSFIPIIGALFTGMVAVLLALVANGWVNALVMLAIVLLVQQVEGHILQPFVMGRAVSLHPLAVVLAVAGGSLLAGIPGALFSVPVLAILNTVVRYIAARSWETDPALGAPAPRHPEPGTAPAPTTGELTEPDTSTKEAST
ncbi:putative PurR-regulated permease PerM [Arthrobacter pigmenti]|uniref:Putative PurR-regulated permease PerM n=1 Tax=Arthrobacter pigmenti TaxID=271432 RepID=A0A846RTY7_9MICC|nr:AI-2E family transporter [Arthrobacter pigmenti]NJC21721.1 putative PurR-regulated permease PerM [Arthrobacter pigmenti]